MKRALMLIVSLSLVVLLSACAPTKPPAAGRETVSAAEYPRVVAQGGLERFVVSGQPSVDYRAAENGDDTRPIAKVVVPVRVAKKIEVPAQYRFIFLDAEGFPVGPMMDWQFKRLPARTQVFLEGIAASADAVDWRLEIRPTR